MDYMTCPKCGEELYLRRGVHSVETWSMEADGQMVELLSDETSSVDVEEFYCDNNHYYAAEVSMEGDFPYVFAYEIDEEGNEIYPWMQPAEEAEKIRMEQAEEGGF